jgi:hypothetical protein
MEFTSITITSPSDPEGVVPRPALRCPGRSLAPLPRSARRCARRLKNTQPPWRSLAGPRRADSREDAPGHVTQAETPAGHARRRPTIPTRTVGRLGALVCCLSRTPRGLTARPCRSSQRPRAASGSLRRPNLRHTPRCSSRCPIRGSEPPRRRPLPRRSRPRVGRRSPYPRRGRTSVRVNGSAS